MFWVGRAKHSSGVKPAEVGDEVIIELGETAELDFSALASRQHQVDGAYQVLIAFAAAGREAHVAQTA